MTRREVLHELTRLSAEERLLLVQELWDSIAADPAGDSWPLTPEQVRVLDERLEAHHQRRALGQTTGSSWNDVKTRVRRGA
jgi:putative addiction module component (TIGR02574 family)